MKLVFLNDRFPYDTEPFVEKELEMIPKDIEGFLVPLYPQNTAQPVPNRIKSLKLVKKSKNTKEIFMSSIFWDELKTAMKKKHPLYNVLKALKFYEYGEKQVYRISSWLRENEGQGPYLFYSYWMYQQAYIAARLKSKFPGSRFITRCHGYDLYEQRHKNNYIPFRKYIFSLADYIFPISNNGKEYLLKTYGKSLESKLNLIRLGTVNNKTFDYERVNHENGVLSIVSCSSISDVKRLDRLISALAEMKQVVYWNHFGDGPLMEKMSQLANALPQNIHWHFCGKVKNAEILQYYEQNHVDAFVNTSESEGVPVSIMEAMSCGIPVIAPDVGGIAEIVHDGINGFLLPLNFTSTNLADQLKAIFDIKISKACFLRANAYNTWKEEYNAEQNYNKFFSVVRDIIK